MINNVTTDIFPGPPFKVYVANLLKSIFFSKNLDVLYTSKISDYILHPRGEARNPKQ